RAQRSFSRTPFLVHSGLLPRTNGLPSIPPGEDSRNSTHGKSFCIGTRNRGRPPPKRRHSGKTRSADICEQKSCASPEIRAGLFWFCLRNRKRHRSGNAFYGPRKRPRFSTLVFDVRRPCPNPRTGIDEKAGRKNPSQSGQKAKDIENPF